MDATCHPCSLLLVTLINERFVTDRGKVHTMNLGQ